MNNRCEHVYKEFGWKRIRDIRVLKCEKCGKIKKENTRIKKQRR